MVVPPGNHRGSNVRRTLSVGRKVRAPRTPGRTAISAVAAGGSCIMRARSPERWKRIVRVRPASCASFLWCADQVRLYLRTSRSILAFPVLHRAYSPLRKAGIRKGDGGLRARGSLGRIVAALQPTMMSRFPVRGRATGGRQGMGGGLSFMLLYLWVCL